VVTALPTCQRLEVRVYDMPTHSELAGIDNTSLLFRAVDIHIFILLNYFCHWVLMASNLNEQLYSDTYGLLGSPHARRVHLATIVFEILTIT